LELPPIRVYPTAPREAAAAVSATIDTTDLATLTAAIGSKVVVQGRTTAATLTQSHTSLIISFGERGKGFNVYVPPKVYPVLNARFGGSAVIALDQKILRVTGTIIAYNQLPEIKIDDADQIELIDTPAATEPAPPDRGPQ
jgi:hypothetical protein